MLTLVIIFIIFTSSLESREVKFSLVIEYTWKIVGGVEKAVVCVNSSNTIGPLIRAREGDIVTIRVFNKLFIQSSSVHWHGIRQKGTPWMDGVPYVTQCPILPGNDMNYTFIVDSPGTYWYHSHSTGQRDDSLFGPFIVDPKEKENDLEKSKEKIIYDEEIILILSDYYHAYEPHSLLSLASKPFRWVGSPQYLLVNGETNYNITLHENRTYLVRVISAAALAWYNISIPNHTLTIIEVDAAKTIPKTVNNLFINAGERYDFLLSANSPGCYHMGISMIDRKGPSGYANIIYDNKNCFQNNSNWTIGYSGDNFNENDLKSLEDDFIPSATRNISLIVVQAIDEKGGITWEMNNVSWIPPNIPLLFPLNYLGKVPNEYFKDIIWVKDGEVIDIIFINRNNWIGLQEQHPMHLHGHSFWIIGNGINPSNPFRNIDRPVKRDTFTLRKNEWVIIRFVANNPGIWVLHCHVSWHLDMGMMLAVAYHDNIPNPPPNFQTCGTTNYELFKVDAIMSYTIIGLFSFIFVVITLCLAYYFIKRVSSDESIPLLKQHTTTSYS